MKIIDENGAAIETPDLTLGYLVDDTEPVEHPAVEGVEEVSHYETVAEYSNGGRDVRKVIDVPGVLRRPHGLNRCRCRDTSATPPKSWPRRKKHARNRKQRTNCRSAWTRWKPQTTILF